MIEHLHTDQYDSPEIRLLKTQVKLGEVIDHLNALESKTTKAEPEPAAETTVPDGGCEHVNKQLTKNGRNYCPDCRRFVR